MIGYTTKGRTVDATPMVGNLLALLARVVPSSCSRQPRARVARRPSCSGVHPVEIRISACLLNCSAGRNVSVTVDGTRETGRRACACRRLHRAATVEASAACGKRGAEKGLNDFSGFEPSGQ